MYLTEIRTHGALITGLNKLHLEGTMKQKKVPGEEKNPVPPKECVKENQSLQCYICTIYCSVWLNTNRF